MAYSIIQLYTVTFQTGHHRKQWASSGSGCQQKTGQKQLLVAHLCGLE